MYNYFWYFGYLYIILYIIHVFFSKDLFGFHLYFNKDYYIKSLWITYVSILYIGFLFLFPTLELFIITSLFTFISIVGYIDKFKNLPGNISIKTYYKQSILHILVLVLPLFIIKCRYKFNTFTVTYVTYVSMIYLITFILNYQNLYKLLTN